jgi:hypothetical protein
MIGPSRMILTYAILLSLCGGASVIQQSEAPSSANELVKAAIQNELNRSDTLDIRWKYLSHKEVDDKSETREVIETKSGEVDRLVSVAGKPLSEAQQRGEIKRILRLSHDADDQRKLEQSQRKDEQQTRAFLKMVPSAFRFEVATKAGDLIKVTFTPSSGFKPSSREGKILHEMAGEIWINSKQRRIARISGQLMNSVTFGGGILGHLERGGHFSVERTEIAPEDWEVTEMDVNMQGKALLFKTISIKQKEIHRNFERVSSNLTIADAAAFLLRDSSPQHKLAGPAKVRSSADRKEVESLLKRSHSQLRLKNACQKQVR